MMWRIRGRKFLVLLPVRISGASSNNLVLVKLFFRKGKRLTLKGKNWSKERQSLVGVFNSDSAKRHDRVQEGKKRLGS